MLNVGGGNSWRTAMYIVRKEFGGQKQSISESAVGLLCYIRCNMPEITLSEALCETGV